jgi:hypothetical protein
VVAASAPAPPDPIKRSSQNGLVGGLVGRLLGDRYGYGYEGRRHGHEDRKHDDGPEVIIVTLPAAAKYGSKKQPMGQGFQSLGAEEHAA